MKKLLVPVLAMTLIISASCNRNANKATEKTTEKPTVSFTPDFSGPSTIIYKTREDYYSKVPVTLTKDGESLSSFPDTKDIYFKGELAYPTRLKEGYLLDNRGINQYSAFLNFSYEEYSSFEMLPPPGELFGMILDKDPFLEIYDCGNRYQFKALEDELNKLIEGGGLVHCRKLTRE